MACHSANSTKFNLGAGVSFPCCDEPLQAKVWMRRVSHGSNLRTATSARQITKKLPIGMALPPLGAMLSAPCFTAVLPWPQPREGMTMSLYMTLCAAMNPAHGVRQRHASPRRHTGPAHRDEQLSSSFREGIFFREIDILASFSEEKTGCY